MIIKGMDLARICIALSMGKGNLDCRYKKWYWDWPLNLNWINKEVQNKGADYKYKISALEAIWG